MLWGYVSDGFELILESEAENLFQLPVVPVGVLKRQLMGVVAHMDEKLCGEIPVDGEVEGILPVTLCIVVVGKEEQTRTVCDIPGESPC